MFWRGFSRLFWPTLAGVASAVLAGVVYCGGAYVVLYLILVLYSDDEGRFGNGVGATLLLVAAGQPPAVLMGDSPRGGRCIAGSTRLREFRLNPTRFVSIWRYV